jgi:hypothetical protein
MNKLWGMVFIGVLWWALCTAFDVQKESSLWSVLWGLVWGLVWVLGLAFVKAFVSPISDVVACHGWCVCSGTFVKDLHISVSNEATFSGLFVCYVIDIMCQFGWFLPFAVHE